MKRLIDYGQDALNATADAMDMDQFMQGFDALDAMGVTRGATIEEIRCMIQQVLGESYEH